ncbi:hypothetical protein L1987_05797 [Smallanthus sonchifolius]|uniref:Uncharacterized protein n=1 Tax=Smallanthus sonchifolius TaxID=185202 RepID=A0ACB9JWC4_9ASTR|nr:hypothetical protein L1987_05797 [Smallanthus sonchifolius]
MQSSQPFVLVLSQDDLKDGPVDDSSEDPSSTADWVVATISTTEGDGGSGFQNLQAAARVSESILEKLGLKVDSRWVTNGGGGGGSLKSGIKSLQQGKKAFTSSVSGADAADHRQLSGVVGSDVGGLLGAEERRKQSDDSLRQVMYMNCWGSS